MPSLRGNELPRGHLALLLALSVAANLLLLAMPIYLMQIYDRVLSSNSLETLVYLTLIAVAALALFGLMESLRSMLAQRLSARYDLTVTSALLSALSRNRQIAAPIHKTLIRDVGIVRQFLASRVFVGLFDLPFVPLFLGILFLAHPVLGSIGVAGAALLVGLAIANELVARTPQSSALDGHGRAHGCATQAVERVEDVRALGMGAALLGRWRDKALDAATQADDLARINSGFFGVVRFGRQAIQIAILGIGAYLVIGQNLSVGLIFAASIVSGRALMPIEQLIGGWRQLGQARVSAARIGEAVRSTANDVMQTRLPEPTGQLVIDEVGFDPSPPGAQTRPVLLRASLELKPGRIVVMLGQSGAGKSTLLRIAAGALMPQSGEVRVDSFRVADWDPQQLGAAIGYVAQDSQLFDGTVAENIARFDPGADASAVVEAANRARCHDLIGGLPEGYETPIGEGGVALSGGQRQRISLARSLYGDPPILILDEPDAHLDRHGEQALQQVLTEAREQNRAVLVVTQRQPILDIADQIVVLQHGVISQVGTRSSRATPANAGATTKTVEPQPSALAERRPRRHDSASPGTRPNVRPDAEMPA
ncbi:MAG: type I secretion system permease/ATPase [Pseudomonadota bacterium]